MAIKVESAGMNGEDGREGWSEEEVRERGREGERKRGREEDRETGGRQVAKVEGQGSGKKWQRLGRGIAGMPGRKGRPRAKKGKGGRRMQKRRTGIDGQWGRSGKGRNKDREREAKAI